MRCPSPTDEPRHFLPVAPAVWLLTSLGLVEDWRWLAAKGISWAALLIASAIQPARRLPGELPRQFAGISTLLALHNFALAQVEVAG